RSSDLYSQKKGESCTFEYDIVLSNPTLQALVTKSVSNSDEIKDMMSALESGENLDSLIGKIRNGDFKNLVEKELKSKDMDDNLKMAHLIAARYLKSIQKGIVAQELAYIISENYNKITSGEKGFDFIIPNYIEEAIKWICQE
ncbi:MAG: putative ATP-dependent endonuclease of the family, partial [Thermoanaerobacterium sp.]|nr:putative ATP-dependent endonuclease of the family [Thermoanaerobacterium sp.]